MGIADSDRTRCRPTRQRGARKQGHRLKALHLTAHRAGAPHAHIQQTRADIEGAASPRGGASWLNCQSSFELGTLTRKATKSTLTAGPIPGVPSKPQNIIVMPDDFGYLVDFGIAEAKGDTHLTNG